MHFWEFFLDFFWPFRDKQKKKFLRLQLKLIKVITEHEKWPKKKQKKAYHFFLLEEHKGIGRRIVLYQQLNAIIEHETKKIRIMCDSTKVL